MKRRIDRGAGRKKVGKDGEKKDKNTQLIKHHKKKLHDTETRCPLSVAGKEN